MKKLSSHWSIFIVFKGFDPAGVFFEQSTVHKLRSDAAEFVDVIHVSSNTLGCNFPMGHVDFYPNGGTSPQPGLPLDVTGKEISANIVFRFPQHSEKQD